LSRLARSLDAEALDAASVNAASFSTADLCTPPDPAQPVQTRRWWWPTLILMALLWLLDAQGVGSLPVHLIGYVLLGLCAGRARRSFAGGWVLAAWFGALGQLHLAFVPGQVAGVGGWLVTLLASALGSRLGQGRQRGTREPGKSRRV
jgi:hypothetical protein